jgi:hypothetical protein
MLRSQFVFTTALHLRLQTTQASLAAAICPRAHHQLYEEIQWGYDPGLQHTLPAMR